MRNKPFLITLGILIVFMISVSILGYFHLRNDGQVYSHPYNQQYIQMAQDLESKANQAEIDADKLMATARGNFVISTKFDLINQITKLRNTATDYRQQALQYRALAQGG
jgi:hypothetical protein